MKKGAGALALALLGVLFVPSWPIQLVSYLSLAVALLSLLYSRAARQAVRIERDTLQLKAHANATVRIGLTIRNSGFLPLAHVAVRDRQGGLRALEAPQALVELEPHGCARLEYALRTAGRGVFDVGPFSLASADPLGLFPWERTVPTGCRITVFPPLGRLRRRVSLGLPGGELGVRNVAYEDAGRFRSIRAYVRGDDTRRIHWKSSARMGTLQTVEYEQALTAPCLVLLDLELPRYPERSRYHFVERAVEAAAALLVASEARRQAVALCANGRVAEGGSAIGFGRGQAHLGSLLELLARIAPSEAAPDLPALLGSLGWRLPPGLRVCLVGPPPAAATLARLRSARDRGAPLEVYQVACGAVERARSAPRGVRLYAVQDYGEELAGDP